MLLPAGFMLDLVDFKCMFALTEGRGCLCKVLLIHTFSSIFLRHSLLST